MSTTVGMLAASALSIGATAIVNGAATEAVKDAYIALKRRVAVWAESDVVALESEPDSNVRSVVVAEAIDRQSDEEIQHIAELTRILSGKIASEDTVGVDIGRLTSLNAQLDDITVSEGTGVRIDDASIKKNLKISSVKVGSKEGNSLR